MKTKLKFVLLRLLSFFFQGVLYSAPFSITLYVIYIVFEKLDNIIPLKIPGLGIVVLVVVITLFGYLSRYIITQPFIGSIKGLIKKAPLINLIYTSVKDLVTAFVGKEKKFKQPVLVKINSVSNLEKIGFITLDDLSFLGIEGKKSAVYFPHSFAFSGELFIVPNENITPIENYNSAEIMKFIVSGGAGKMTT